MRVRHLFFGVFEEGGVADISCYCYCIMPVICFQMTLSTPYLTAHKDNPGQGGGAEGRQFESQLKSYTFRLTVSLSGNVFSGIRTIINGTISQISNCSNNFCLLLETLKRFNCIFLLSFYFLSLYKATTGRKYEKQKENLYTKRDLKI